MQSYDLAWSPDSKWIAYPRSMPNHLHAIFLYSVDSGTVDAGDERDGRVADYRPSIATESISTSPPAPTPARRSDGLDMTSDLYQVTSNIYAHRAGSEHGIADCA